MAGLRRWIFSAWVLVPSAVEADERGLKAELSCRPEAAPGRVLCELRYSVDAGARLAWADALVTASPDFARPLRSRVTPERFGRAEGGERKLSLAFVASKAGVGEVTVRARAVVCRGAGAGERCRPQTEDVQAEIRVGS
jgi:hypothetical protein